MHDLKAFIVLIRRNNANFVMFVLIVVGCAKLSLSEEYWVDYFWKGTEAQVGCRNNDNSWRLKCEKNLWDKKPGNCSEITGKVF